MFWFLISVDVAIRNDSNCLSESFTIQSFWYTFYFGLEYCDEFLTLFVYFAHLCLSDPSQRFVVLDTLT
jgi:hypothetical protein